MLPFLSMAGNRAVDDHAIGLCAIPGRQLMETAGRAVVREMLGQKILAEGLKILILAGQGNNGGDGYVVAADLLARGFSVSILSVIGEELMKGDALHHFKKLLDLEPDFAIWKNTAEQQQLILEADVIVDALLGTGTKGQIRSPYTEIIAHCNAASAKIVAVDVPSGVSGDQGHILDPCIKADLTVSMGFGKQGCLFEPARSRCGRIIPVDIGFPADSIEQVKVQPLFHLEATDFNATQFARPADTHKYTAGKVLVIAGSRGFSGAGILSATAALRSGAGLVKLAVPDAIAPIAEGCSVETIVSYLPETSTGGIAYTALDTLIEASAWADVVALGPGIGRHPETLKLVQKLIPAIKKPLVLDADGLFALAQDLECLKQREAPTILTPHLGEFKRLVKLPADSRNPWEEALNFAQTHKIFLLLKGAPSILASPQGQVFVNSSGYAGMATAGSGDVLTGIIAALWSQWDHLPEVLNFAMFIHGQAAELKRAEKGVLGLIAGDIVEALPGALKEYGGLPA